MRPQGGNVALFIVVLVALVIGQTWWDWRDVRRQSKLPEWASGMALAAIVAAALAAATSFSSVVYQSTVGEFQRSFASGFFWPELGFLLCGMGLIVAAVSKKNARALLLLAAILTFTVWLGIALAA